MLQGITLDSTPVSVWGKVVPPSVEPPYIYIPTQSSTDDSAKDTFLTDNSFNIEVVAKSIGGGNSSDTELISDQVKQKLYGLPSMYPDVPGFGIVWIKFESDTEINDYVNGAWLFRKILTFSAKVQEG